MKLGETIRKAVRMRDPHLLGKCVDVLRFKFKMNYQDCLECINHISGAKLTESKFEAMMYHADMEG